MKQRRDGRGDVVPSSILTVFSCGPSRLVARSPTLTVSSSRSKHPAVCASSRRTPSSGPCQSSSATVSKGMGAVASWSVYGGSLGAAIAIESTVVHGAQG